MKKLTFYSLAAISILAASCSEDIYEEPKVIPAAGEEVRFGLDLGGPQTRTMYGTEKDGLVQEIFWGNYIAEKAEKIRIFSPKCAAGRTVADYLVNPKTNPNSSIAEGILKTGDFGVQWGTEEAGYEFFAVYPADQAGANISDDAKISVTISNGQSPVNYGYGPDGTGALVDNSVITNPNSNTSDPARVIYGNPDMSNAIMFAYTPDIAKTNEPVGLRFQMLADVLEVTVNGPIVRNLLNGGTQESKYVRIQNITVKSKSKKYIGGNFTFDMRTGKCDQPTTGVTELNMSTAISNNGSPAWPLLYYHGNDSYDQLKVRFFMIPESTTPDDIQIVVNTNFGEYTQDGLEGSFINGQIHKVKLPHFHRPGTTFDFKNWISQLDKNIYVNELSIPGAWHAANQSYQATTDFTAQFEAGIRAFEFHTGISNNTAIVYETSTKLTDVFSTLGGLLNQHSGEFIVVEIGRPEKWTNWPQVMKEAIEASSASVYQGEIGPNTTIDQVKGKIIVKVNTNEVDDEENWRTQTPALFSRWEEGANGACKTISLKWGEPVAPDGESNMKWCFAEYDNIDGKGGGVNKVIEAVDDCFAQARENYISGMHDTWYECGIGGYTSSATATELLGVTATGNKYQKAAILLNTYMLGKLNDPNRYACPLGLVLMNYCTGSNDTYKSSDLIQSIIYNNNSFILNRAGSGTPAENNNSYFNSNPLNPLK